MEKEPTTASPNTVSSSAAANPDAESPAASKLALVLTGGGARAAYQVGLLRCMARHMPDLQVPIITGVSAGAINAAFLASHPGSLKDAAHDLSKVWEGIEFEHVFRVGVGPLLLRGLRWLTRLVSGGSPLTPAPHGLVDTEPLRELLERTLETGPDGEIVGIQRNLDAGRLDAVALVTLRYSTGQTITWCQGKEVTDWRRVRRRSQQCRLNIEHVMASSALPLFFPAAKLDQDWYGDGGIRLSAPLSPALHLGADRVLAVSTRYQRSPAEADEPAISGYPPPAQIVGNLMNSVFLDVLDRDILRLQRLDSLVRRLPVAGREGMRPLEIMLLRPSVDLGKLSANYEVRIPKGFRWLTRSLGTRQTKSPDFLAMLMFQPDYLRQLIDIGERDAEARLDEIARLVSA